MIKNKRLPDDIFVRLNAAGSYLVDRDDVLFAYLFGGLATGQAQPLSDVDIAVYVKQGADMAETKISILGALVDILGTDELDLVILNKAPLPLKARVIRAKHVMVDKEPFERHRFESLVIREYFDFSIKENSFFNQRYRIG